MSEKQITLGKKFEWAICNLSSAENSIEQRKEKNPYLISPIDERIKNKAVRASELIKTSESSNCFHFSELRISGFPEPKTDILQLKDNGDVLRTISVKLDGDSQIISAEGKTIANIFQLIGHKDQELTKLLEELPTKLIDPINAEKAKTRKLHIVSAFFENDVLLDKFNWNVWERDYKQKYLDYLQELFSKNNTLYDGFIKECLTGERLYKYNPYATAKYILKPDEFRLINDLYISSIKDKLSVDIRGKSRAGITSAALRIDMKG